MTNNTEILWSRFEGKMKAFILDKVRDRAAAEDILQEVFIRIHKNIGSLRDQSKMEPWIYQITRNTITDHFRGPHSKNIPFHPAHEKEESSGEDFMNETLQDMVKMMDNLPPEYCEALCLTELGNMSQKEYARMAGISYSGAKSRVQRAKKLLRDMMMKCCHYHFDKYGTVYDISPAGCCCCTDHPH